MESNKNKNNKKKMFLTLIAVVAFLGIAIGATYSYLIVRLGGGLTGDVNATTGTTDSLKLEATKGLEIMVTDDNFLPGAGNLTDTTTGTATLMANNTTNRADYTYNVYLYMIKNEFEYTSPDSEPELLLQVKAPGEDAETKNELTSIDGLNYVTVNGVSGFDITTVEGLVPLYLNYEISTTSMTTQEWEFSLVFVNLETDQYGNLGKKVQGRILMRTTAKNESNFYVATTLDKAPGKAPAAAGARVSLSCADNKVSYNKYYNRIEVTSINEQFPECTLDYTTTYVKTKLNDYVKGLVNKTQGTGQVLNENGYRYEGKNPNNYVWFNNELWRIIGVFDKGSHGKNGQWLTKLIRNDSIGTVVWDKSNNNNYNTSSLKQILNAYYNKQNATGNDYCYAYSTTISTVCDYSGNGLGAEAKSMLESVTWYLGSNNVNTAVNMYGYERSSTVYSTNPATVTGYVGLMYPSDYGYSVLASSCARTTSLSNYATALCGGASWLYGQGYEWTLSPYNGGSNGYYINYNGQLTTMGANQGQAIRPVVYLKSSVYIVDGNGSATNPYVLGTV